MGRCKDNLLFCLKTAAIVCFAGVLKAHEMTPTYFKFKHAVWREVHQTRLSLFNRREDQIYYQVAVYDKDFNPIPFASKTRLLKVLPYERADFLLYVRNEDVDDVVYICTESKTPKGEIASTGVTSRICSKKEE